MIALAALALLAWAYLLLLHGRFWQAGPVLAPARPRDAPPVDVVIPARDEADGIGAAIRSLLAQDYEGPLHLIVVDDRSTDGTAAIARSLVPSPSGRGLGEGLATGGRVVSGGTEDPHPHPLPEGEGVTDANPLLEGEGVTGERRLTVITGAPRPPGWSGKLWAVHQGVQHAAAGLILLTDADILHDPEHVGTLVAKAETGLDLVSEMVALRTHSPAERALVPAFVFFFQLLYPFARVNDPRRRTAAAAGGTMLVRAAALRRIGGIASLRGALIDDVTLARRIKQGGPTYLGHSRLARSLRPYPGAGDIWRMVARTAYVQLRFSPLLLAATLLGLGLIWLLPPALALFGHGAARWLGALAWAGSAASYMPTLRRFGLSPLWALALPAIATFYAAATVGSALDHHRGRGVVWKNRAYRDAEA